MTKRERTQKQKIRRRIFWTLVTVLPLGFLTYLHFSWGESWPIFTVIWAKLLVMSTLCAALIVWASIGLYRLVRNWTNDEGLSLEKAAAVGGAVMVVTLVLGWNLVVHPIMGSFYEEYLMAKYHPSLIVLYPSDGRTLGAQGYEELRDGDHRNIRFETVGRGRSRVKVCNWSKCWFAVYKGGQLIDEVRSSHHATLTTGEYTIKVYNRIDNHLLSKASFSLSYF